MNTKYIEISKDSNVDEFRDELEGNALMNEPMIVLSYDYFKYLRDLEEKVLFPCGR